MPGKRAKPAPEPDLEPALAALTVALAGSHVPWMVIGGAAVAMRGVKRMTTDVDAVVQGDAITAAALAKLLTRHQFALRSDDAVEFARTSLVLLVRHAPSRIELDISFGWTDFEVEALAARTSARYGSTSVPTARPEDLVIYKALAGRPKDHDDIATILALHPSIDLARVRRHVAALAALAETPELVEQLERLIQATPRAPALSSSPPRVSSTRPVKRPKRT